MHEDHEPGEHGHEAVGGRRALGIALLLTLAFTGAEVAGGLWTGSLALLADAAHMFSDALALGVALAAAIIARRPPDARRTMGYERAEVLGALFNAATLVALAGFILVEAWQRLVSPPDVRGLPMLGIAAGGLVVNLVMAWLLHRAVEGGHDHAHGHLHDAPPGRAPFPSSEPGHASAHGGSDLNLRAALWHVVGDVLGSVAALAAGAALWLGDWRLADPVASVAIASILLVGGVRVGKEAVQVLMQSAPPDLDLVALRGVIEAEPDVLEVHGLHVWCLAPGQTVLTVHVVVREESDPVEACARVRARLLERVPLRHVTVQPEHPTLTCAATVRPAHPPAEEPA